MPPSDYISMCATIVAACALAATFWQGWLAFQHNRLSVRPHLVWHVARTNDTDKSGICFSIRNLGVGPAIIRDRYFQKYGVRFQSLDLKTDTVQSFVEFAFGKNMQYNLKSFGLPGMNSAVSSQGQVVIADIEFPGGQAENLNDALELAGKISFHVTYESLYREKYTLYAT